MGGLEASSKKSESGLARFCGSASSGLLELLGFHPVDTVAKRLMSNQSSIFVKGAPLSESMASLNKVVFKSAAEQSFIKKYTSLFPGLGFAAGYKITQRVYKYGGQPYVKDYLNTNHRSFFTNFFGEKTGKTVMHATAGSIVGIGEVALLPLDVLKIKSQTNPETLKGRGIFALIKDEGLGLYRGGMWTAARNAPGSFALFGGAAIVKEYFFGLKDYNQATFFQNFCSSIGGAVASITVAAPLDVVKTRIQNRPFDAPESGMNIIKDMIKKEGMGAFFKGLTPKILVVGPKLIFSFTVAQQLIPIFHETFEKAGITHTSQA
ncbi:mitochondrial carrier [Neoconidiobolus thromboides FSU 785]|nr:mitochondrial carrier [Neoconidiobolus thromboides FSU 785]